MCRINPRVDFAFKKLFGSEENRAEQIAEQVCTASDNQLRAWMGKVLTAKTLDELFS